MQDGTDNDNESADESDNHNDVLQNTGDDSYDPVDDLTFLEEDDANVESDFDEDLVDLDDLDAFDDDINIETTKKE